MIFNRFLSALDAGRAHRALQRLFRHDISQFALTGGLAIEIHRITCGVAPTIRLLNDIDFITDSFESIPSTLERDYLFRHIHPGDGPGKTLLQAVDPDAGLRIDVFHAYGTVIRRTLPYELPEGAVQIISIPDLTARAARLSLDTTNARKYALDFLRLLPIADPAEVEAVWPDHRKPGHPESFRETCRQLQELIPARGDVPVAVTYSKDVTAVCGRCRGTDKFRLADSRLVFSLLGYV